MLVASLKRFRMGWTSCWLRPTRRRGTPCCRSLLSIRIDNKLLQQGVPRLRVGRSQDDVHPILKRFKEATNIRNHGWNAKCSGLQPFYLAFAIVEGGLPQHRQVDINVQQLCEVGLAVFNRRYPPYPRAELSKPSVSLHVSTKYKTHGVMLSEQFIQCRRQYPQKIYPVSPRATPIEESDRCSFASLSRTRDSRSRDL